MDSRQIILLLINVIGGVAVIGSYIIGIATHQQGANMLWGGVPLSTRAAYAGSMILAALGYFAFIYFTLFRLDTASVKIAGSFDYSLFYAVFAVILGASALWMPLTFSYLSNYSAGMGFLVRLVLVLGALGSIGLVLVLLGIQPRPSGWAFWLAVVGAGYFAFHTTVLDAIIWPVLFKS
jgi:hypothetical protein